eukprot:93140_1
MHAFIIRLRFCFGTLSFSFILFPQTYHCILSALHLCLRKSGFWCVFDMRNCSPEILFRRLSRTCCRSHGHRGRHTHARAFSQSHAPTRTSQHALMFPGQGSQRAGMAHDLMQFRVARRTLEEIEEAINLNLREIMFDGNASELRQTEYAQPALLAHSAAVWRIIESELGLKNSEFCDVALGHSVGEFSALWFSGCFSLFDAARIVRERGLAMAKCGKSTQEATCMAALMPLDMATAEAICARAVGDSSAVCQVANVNAPTQIVLSGHRKAVEIAIDIAKSGALGRKVKRAVFLDVSAPFHCSLMYAAAERLREVLENCEIHRPEVPVISNVTAKEISDPSTLRDLIPAQVTSPVRWSDSVQHAACAPHYAGRSFVEVGCGAVLRGLVPRILPERTDVAVRSIGTYEEVVEFIKSFDDR